MFIRIIAIIYVLFIFAIADHWTYYNESQIVYDNSQTKQKPEKLEKINLTVSEDVIEAYLKEHQEEERKNEYKYFF